VVWVPQKVMLRVRSSSGATIDLETVRLFRKRTE
jgi:general secretion pathway protein I